MQAILSPTLFLMLTCSFSIHAAALILQPIKVAPNVYAVVGDLGQQTYANNGLNNNLGFIVGTEGVLVINSGPSVRVAEALHAAIQKITPQPIKWVVNGNSQSHYWLGNAYFKKLNLPILAHQEALRVMREMGANQLQTVTSILKEKAEQIVLAYPNEILQDKRTINLGNMTAELLYFGPAHTTGDVVVWLPREKILFSGDIVFTERMLGVLPIGNSGGWLKAFDRAMALQPKVVVPGHGRPTDVKRATRDTKDYLTHLRSEVKKIANKNGSLQDAVEKIDQSKFKYLLNFDLLAKRNVNQVYTEMEQEAF